MAAKRKESKDSVETEVLAELELTMVVLRENVHSMSNALFVMKGMLPDLQAEIDGDPGSDQAFDRESLSKRLSMLERNISKADAALENLRRLARKSSRANTSDR